MIGAEAAILKPRDKKVKDSKDRGTVHSRKLKTPSQDVFKRQDLGSPLL